MGCRPGWCGMVACAKQGSLAGSGGGEGVMQRVAGGLLLAGHQATVAFFAKPSTTTARKPTTPTCGWLCRAAAATGERAEPVAPWQNHFAQLLGAHKRHRVCPRRGSAVSSSPVTVAPTSLGWCNQHRMYFQHGRPSRGQSLARPAILLGQQARAHNAGQG